MANAANTIRCIRLYSWRQHNRMAYREPCRSIQNFYAILFDHGVRQNLVSDGFQVLRRLLAGDAIGDCDVEELALADRVDCGIAQTVQRGADGLALWVQHG